MVDEGHVLYIIYIYVFEEKKIHCQICVPPQKLWIDYVIN